MKKILLSAMVLATMGTFAQVKVGTNPTVLATNANFQVEGAAPSNQFIVLKNGRVGIGTTTPLANAHIQSPSSGAQRTLLLIESNSWGTGQNQADSFLIRAGEGASVSTNGGAFTVNGQGIGFFAVAVGIGTASPTSTLDVAGNARIQTLPAGAGTDEVVTTDASGNLRKLPAATFTGAIGPQGPAGPQGATGLAGSNATADGDAWGVTGEDTTSEIGRLGNVGIGTTAPTKKLHVNATDEWGGIQVDNTSATTTGAAQMVLKGSRSWAFQSNSSGNGNGAGALQLVDNDASNAVRMTFATTGNVGFRTPFPQTAFHIDGAADNLTAGVPAPSEIANDMVVTSTGNVGIGTTTPTTAKLVIAGNVGTQGIDLSSSDTYANLRVIQNTNSIFDKDLYIGYGSGTTSSLHLYSDNTETVTVKGSNVGIGTTTPISKLHIIASNINSSLILQGGDFAAGYGAMWVQGSGFNQNLFISGKRGSTGNNTTDDLTQNVVGSNILLNHDGGNVGIGTTAPAAKLEVNGFIKVGSSDTATPSAGMIKFNSATSKFQGFDGTAWVDLH